MMTIAGEFQVKKHDIGVTQHVPGQIMLICIPMVAYSCSKLWMGWSYAAPLCRRILRFLLLIWRYILFRHESSNPLYNEDILVVPIDSYY